MKIPSNFKADKYIMHISLAISIFTNIVFVQKIYFPNALEYVREKIEKPPTITQSDHLIGNRKSGVIVIAYMDYQCPYCGILYPILRKTSEKGSILFVYRHFPLKSHPFALRSSEAAECAGQQGKFWEYSDLLYSKKDNLSNETFKDISMQLHLDNQLFNSCLHKHSYFKYIYSQQKEGIERRINATPTFFINGNRFNGLIPKDKIIEIIKEQSVSAR